ncbi:amidohydrolase family protein [Asticcacaulis sp. SL142]|uniref:Xaa-Pro dipeptidase n=1 Tax=Asticcacaulis sp. SL142 TaxID=2995155 RepID=UPI00226CEE90|nr:amidohydrolase family protein [Asticcacaulis sp. SL142]WAC49439.1 amidohydrolase family protein [Asticcacaulis sp. SL142]
MKNLWLATCAFIAVTGAAEAKTVVVNAAKLIEVETGKVVEKPAIMIIDGRIAAVGPQGQLNVPSDAELINLPEVTLLPGLIDMHVHLDSDPTYGGYTGLQFTDRFWGIMTVPNAEKTLKAGFTTVRNVGAGDYNDVGLREAIEEGVVKGPRVVTAAMSFGATGGHCDSTYFPPSFQSKNPYNADSPAEGVRSVRTLKKYGAQVIKICATGGVFSRGTTPGGQQLSYEEMKAIVDEAHMQGLKVAAHAHGASGIRDAIRAGVDTIEHASLVDDEGIKLAVQKGAWFSMDIYNTEYTQSEGAKNGVLEESLKKDRDIAEIQRQNFKKALKAGVRMVYGTDSGVYPHGDNAKQFAVMVRYGATPLQAIQSATVNAAQALGQAKDVGSLRVGHYGDMIGVVGDPLTDVTVLEKPAFVMKGGEVVAK